MTFLKLTLLSLSMHAKRTLVIVFAIAVSTAVMLTIDAMLSGMRSSFFQDILRDSGHVQLHAEGWADRLEPLSLRYAIDDSESLLQELRGDPRVAAADAVLRFGALTIADDERMPQVGIGVDAETSFFSNARSGIRSGRFPEAEEDIAVSTKVADIFEREVGDPLVALVQDSQGSPYYVEYRISGLFETNSEQFDTGSFFITHKAAEELVYLPDQTIEIRINLGEADEAAAFVAERKDLFAEYGVQARTWREIHGSFIVIFELFDVFVFFINFLVTIVSATVITNAVLMNMFRRIEEFGTLRAIGLTRRRQTGLIMLEGALQGVVGGVLGVVIGAPVALYFQQNGIDIGAISESFGLGNTIFFELRTLAVFQSIGFGILIALAGSAYAAWVGGRMRIVEMFAGTH